MCAVWMAEQEVKNLHPPPIEGLTSLTMEGIAEYIKSGKAKKILIMQGAGISTATGIPDFRSPNGIYANLADYNLPFPEAVFDIKYFAENPKPFYKLNSEFVKRNVKPTLAHYFESLLVQKGLVKRIWTQNVDGLERAAGIHEEYLVEVHGTFRVSHCTKCNAAFSYDEMKEPYCAGEPVKCPKEGCDGLVKPDVVFFSEPLPQRFQEMLEDDFTGCDLAIVIGTSLQVQPFATLPIFLRTDIPRIMFNMNPARTYEEKLILYEGQLLDANAKICHGLFKFGHVTNRRDVFVGGDCQQTLLEFARALGFEDELNEMMAHPELIVPVPPPADSEEEQILIDDGTYFDPEDEFVEEEEGEEM